MSDVPLCSSDQVVRALERAGFRSARRSSGSQQAFTRTTADGRTITTVVVLGKCEVPRGTLRDIIRRAELTIDEFLRLLR